MPQDWYFVTLQALQDLWVGLLYFIPSLVGAVIVFLIGWFLASLAGFAANKIFGWLKLNQLFNKGQWDEALEKAGIKADVSGFLSQICRWIVVIAFLTASMKILGWEDFAGFLSNVLNWLPNVIVAVLMFVVAVVIADILEKLVVASVSKAKLRHSKAMAMIVRWSIYIFAFLAILSQLQLGAISPLAEMLFTGIVALMVISLGLAFGLGGRDLAKEILENLYQSLKRE